MPSLPMLLLRLMSLPALLAAVGFVLIVPALAVPPIGQTSYRLKATFSLPYADIVEPVDVWVEKGNGVNKQRIDFYNGLNSYFYMPTQLVEVVPTDYQMQCLTLPGQQDIQQFFPDLSKYSLIGEEKIRDIKCQHLQLVQTIGGKVNTYDFYYDSKNHVPIRFSFLGFNVLGGSHYDRYIFEYLEYEEVSGAFSPHIWGKTNSFNCHDMPDSMKTGFAGVNELANIFNSASHNYVDEKFDEFKSRHSKEYANEQEHNRRKDIFRQNLHFIHSKNRGRKGDLRLAVNHLADKTEEEMHRMRPMKGRYSPAVAPFTHVPPPQDLHLPRFFDWRAQGAVSHVKDQGNCGSCWSFGSSEAIEGAVFAQTGKLITLSAQSLVDCSWKYGNNGCDGGLDYQAYQFVIDHGSIATEESYPYLMADGLCHIDDAKQASPIKSWANVSSRSVRALKHALLTSGPISVGLDASHRSLSFYKSGVYYEPNCKIGVDDLDHAVLLVGFGSLPDGEEYWIVKNSWSKYWGNDGYFHMSFRNDCGISTQPTYVIPAAAQHLPSRVPASVAIM